MIAYSGVESSGQVTRSCVRIVLAGGFSFEDFFSGHIIDTETWPAKVNHWRDSVAAGDFIVPATTSLPAFSQLGEDTGASRAVVDVQILGANQGVSYGAVAAMMDKAVSRVDVLSMTRIETITDASGRGAILQQAIAQAEKESLSERIGRMLSKSLLVLGIGAGLIILAYLLLRSRK